MDSKFNLSQLAELFYQEGNISRADAEQFSKVFFDTIASAVTSGQIVKVKGLGTFKPLEMNERESVNVNTGERIVIPGYTKISFTPDSALKDEINKPYADFEIVTISADGDNSTAEPVVPEVVEADNESVEPEETERTTAVAEPVAAVQEVSVATIQTEPAATVMEGQSAVEPEPAPVKPRRKGGLKLLLTILCTILVLLLISYCLWPINLLHQIRLGQTQLDCVCPTDTPAVIAPTAGPEAEPIAEPEPEPIAEPEAEPVAEPKAEAVAETVVEPVIEKVEPVIGKSVVKLPAKLENAKLEDLSYSDTLDMVINGTAGTHVLQYGETLTRLALEWYGTKKLWPYIAAYNNVSDASDLKSGKELKMPSLAAK